MKILFLARRCSYYRNYDSVIRSLAARGHVLHLAVDRENAEGLPLVERLTAEYPNVTYEELPPRAGDDWTWLAGRLRHGIEHLRYQHPMFDDTPKLRARSAARTPGGFVRLGEFVRHRAAWARRPITALLDWLERSVPENPEFRAFIERHRPDLVMLTPLIGLGSQQIDYLRAARSLNIPTGLAVWSWDHLSSKALIRELPDRVFVWNTTQKREAFEYHGVPEDRIAVTGAQCFDRWFGRRPSRDRYVLGQSIGLTPVRPFILYVCSAPFIGSQPEAPFVVEWVRRVRESAGVLREVPILIRPHPSRVAEWAGVDVSPFRDVVVWGSSPVDPASRNDYFDSLYHSAAVVGLNTSAFIEAGIVGRPVLTILLPEWHESQLGTAHFRYLFEAGGGLLVSARSFDEHLAQLERAVTAPPEGLRPFVREFVRPLGLEVPATPIFVERVEAMEGLKVSQPEPPPFESLARWILGKLRPWRDDAHRDRLVYAESELDTVRRLRASREVRAERKREMKKARARDRAVLEAARQDEIKQFRAAKRAEDKAAARRGGPMTSPMTGPADSSRAFAVYERVRDAVRQITGTPAAAAPSAYWSEELENIDYMIEASPLIIRKLRHHAYHISNVRPYDYRIKADARRENFEARLRALQQLDGRALQVPESPALGGFGYEIDGRLFNVDTLKFYEVLVGMERAGVLASLRAVVRPMVCEIGAGWAGFAYQFRTFFPTSRYVIVDFAELFLFSATYLGALFPDARMAFCGTAETPSVSDAGDADFIFVPHTMAAQVASLPLDLTVNMVSFQEMTDPQVRAYTDMAADAGCPWLYSFNRDRSPFNTEITSVAEAIAERYQLTEVSVLPTDYTTVLKRPPKAGKNVERNEFNYRHLAGRLAPSARSRLRASRVGEAGTTPGGRGPGEGPQVVLGMTLYNKDAHLSEALDSVLAQTFGEFRLVLLDDASADGTEAIARAYAARDPRIIYVRHDSRHAMVATWREVVDVAVATCPSARYFAWVSDHDRWHPRWLDRLLGEIEAHPGTVLTYPITRRIAQDGAELEKGPRLFDTAGVDGVRARWSRFCREGIGSGDMVYGLMDIEALRKAGVFRPVLRPDRLLIAELSLHGQIRQVPEVLWFRRDSEGASVDRQRHSLFLPGQEPKWFGAPPWFQHVVSLWHTYVAGTPALGLSRTAWMTMLAQYQVTYGWRHFRKTEASHAIGRGIDNAIWVKKLTKHYWHHAVYATLVGGRIAWGRARRLGRRGIYEALMLTHRLGLRGGGNVGTR